MPGERVFVIGCGMTKFEKPGRRAWDYPDMGKEAVTKALSEAALPYDSVQEAYVGWCYGDSTCGQRALYECGMTGIPIVNVNNNCSTGATALYLAARAVKSQQCEVALALGFEKMERGSLTTKWGDRSNPLGKHVQVIVDNKGAPLSSDKPNAPFAPVMFGSAGREHMRTYGTKAEHFAKIAEKNHRHSQHNPYSQFRDVYTLQQIQQSPVVFEPLTMLQCCPTSEGAAAAVLVSETWLKRQLAQGGGEAERLRAIAVEVCAIHMCTDFRGSFEDKSCIKAVGADMGRAAAEKVYKETGLKPQDFQVVELHDCFSANELLTYEALGLAQQGQAGALIDSGRNTYPPPGTAPHPSGHWVVNPSGGLISKGHPLGATGIAQLCELSWQLRGWCGPRQVANCTHALQHNLGLGGAAVVAAYRLADPSAPPALRAPGQGGRPNPALDPTAYWRAPTAEDYPAGGAPPKEKKGGSKL